MEGKDRGDWVGQKLYLKKGKEGGVGISRPLTHVYINFML